MARPKNKRIYRGLWQDWSFTEGRSVAEDILILHKPARSSDVSLAPMQYLEIPVATFIGWLVFYDLPNGLAALGILVTIGAGLYIVLRERSIARLEATEVI